MTDTPPAAPAPEGFVSSRARTRHRSWWWQVLGELGSVHAAAVLIATVTLVVFGAAYYEGAYGAQAAQVLIYYAWWFNSIFLLLTMCVVTAVVVRWPLKKHQWGFAVVHLGLVLLIAGFARAGSDRLDGMLEAPPDREASLIALPIDQVVAREVDGGTETQRWGSFRFPTVAGLPSLPRFALSPLWPLPEPGIHTLPDPMTLCTLPKGAVVRLTRTLECGRPEAGFLAGDGGQPAVRLRLAARTPMSPEPMPMGDRWLSLAGEAMMSLGPATVTFARTNEPGLAEDFLADAADTTAHGTLLIHWQGKRHAVAVEGDRLPQAIDLGPDLGLTVVRVITNPKQSEGNLVQDPAAEVSPLVELVLRQGTRTRTFYASTYHLLPPLGPGLPEVLFRHGELTAPSGGQGGFVQLLAAPDGRLLVRSFTRSKGAVARGATQDGRWSGVVAGAVDGPMAMTADLTYLPSAVSGPEPMTMRPERKDRSTRWVEVEVAKDGKAARTWLSRGSRQSVTLEGYGPILLSYQQAIFDLKQERGFSIRLDRFDEGKDPGGMMSASYASDVTVVPVSGEPWKAHISMNEPLHVGSVTLYQTQFMPEMDDQGRPTGRSVSVFTAAEDPGRFLKYLGGYILVGGILLLYLWRPRRKAA